MELKRRIVIAGGGAAAMLSTARAAKAEAPANPWDSALSADGDTIKALHVIQGTDGKSKIEDIDLPPDQSLAPKLFQQFLTHKASKVAIYQAPPHHAIAEARPAKDLLLIVDGTTMLSTDGGSRKIGSGTFVLFDGVAKHTEKSGPTGYVAIKVRLAD